MSTRHMASVHEGKKPFIAVFVILDLQERHTWMHTFSCKICDVRFTQSGSLNGYISAIHEVNMAVDMGTAGICKKKALQGIIKLIVGTFSFLYRRFSKPWFFRKNLQF